MTSKELKQLISKAVADRLSKPWNADPNSIAQLIGGTITHIEGDLGSRQLIFTLANGDRYRMYDYESGSGNDVSVYLEDIAGDLKDLLGTPVLSAYETIDKIRASKNPDDESYTWAFYRILTRKGLVVLRWYGASNGYYSEIVSFSKMSAADTPDPLDTSWYGRNGIK